VNLVTDWVTYTNNSAGSRGLVRDAGGNLYLTDWLNNRIVKITPAGVQSVFAGNGTSGAVDGVGTAATFAFPYGLAIDAAGNIYVADSGNSAVRKITPDGTVSTYARMPGTDLLGPIALDPSGNLYLAVFPSSILRIDASRNVTSFPLPGVPDFISSLVADGQGHLYANTRGIGAQVLKITF
jgi:streptogramin lyase